MSGRRTWARAAATALVATTAAGAAAAGGRHEPSPRAETAHRDARVWNELGNRLVVAGELGAAETVYRRASAADPGNAGAHLDLGRLLLDLGRLREAQRELERTVELEPANGVAHYLLGRAHERTRRAARARRAFQRAFALDPRLADPDSNPDLAASPQALAAQLVGWLREEPGEVERRSAPPRAPSGAERDPSDGAVPARHASPRRNKIERSPTDGIVLDAGDLRRGRVVHQARPRATDDRPRGRRSARMLPPARRADRARASTASAPPAAPQAPSEPAEEASEPPPSRRVP